MRSVSSSSSRLPSAPSSSSTRCRVAGKSLPGLGAGWLVDQAGWSPVFLAGVVLSAAFLPLLVPLRRVHEASVTT